MLVDIGYYVWRTPLTREREREYTFVYEQNSFACKTPRGAAQRSAAQRSARARASVQSESFYGAFARPRFIVCHSSPRLHRRRIAPAISRFNATSP